MFKLDLRDAKSDQTVINMSQEKSQFLLTNLRPGHGYIITVYALNGKGISEPMTLHAFTLAETSPEQIVADTSRQGQAGDLVVTPVLVILIAFNVDIDSFVQIYLLRLKIPAVFELQSLRN